jgi:hypothetical protein
MCPFSSWVVPPALNPPRVAIEIGRVVVRRGGRRSTWQLGRAGEAIATEVAISRLATAACRGTAASTGGPCRQQKNCCGPSACCVPPDGRAEVARARAREK